MKKLNKGTLHLKRGKLFYNVKASYDEAALRFVADQQAQIDSYERSLDDILMTLMSYKNVSIKHSDDHKIEQIHNLILVYKKALLETESGREFLAKYDIKIFKDKESK